MLDNAAQDQDSQSAQGSQDLLRSILPYTYIVGQDRLKLALELAYIAPRLGGVLLSGKRGTAKSTIVRAFASMMYTALPVTIPINATEDRVVGGWRIKELTEGIAKPQPGLLEEAHTRLLYIDEVNLLDDHIVNIILDVTSTGKLIIQREGRNEQRDVRTTLVGTMNPEEGWLRPQLLDRFGLMVHVESVTERTLRYQILQTVLKFDRALLRERAGENDAFLEQGRQESRKEAERIRTARDFFASVQLSSQVAHACVLLAEQFQVEGHRADYLLALAACANAARYQQSETSVSHLREVADLVLRHRFLTTSQLQNAVWGPEENQKVQELLTHV